MKKYTKIFILFATVLFGIISTKLYNEYHANEKLKLLIVQNEADSLSYLIAAFRKTYQESFIQNNIPINNDTVHLLPVKTIKNISDDFTEMLGERIRIHTVSDRPRNLDNKANTQELAVIKYFNENKDKKSYFYKLEDDSYYYAKPLYITNHCLKCHGKKENAPLTIQQRYDTAYDYMLGELRGITSITVHKEDTINKLDENYLRSVKAAIIVYILFLLSIYFLIRIIVKNKEEYTRNLEDKIIEEVRKSKEIEKQLFQSEKMAAMGEMIGNIAHQWRQPLSVISAAATGTKLQKELGVLTDEGLNDNLTNINTNAQYLSETINDFRNFIKGDRQSLLFNVKEQFDSFLHLVDGSVTNHHIKVMVDNQDEIYINGYPNELIQCFINIFNNAKDVLTLIDQKNRLFFISSKRIDNDIIIVFKDNAGGIPQDILPKIFDPYFTTKHQSTGTGLGLHMTYNLIVDGMNGTIKASNVEYSYENKKYVGAQFMITLPLS
ncbi:MAG: DUF3365 domain-containing protein [Campylobacterota bacterium]|nr:DUF3365 domain-containing protein [Campylobacterota bacterium]